MWEQQYQKPEPKPEPQYPVQPEPQPEPQSSVRPTPSQSVARQAQIEADNKTRRLADEASAKRAQTFDNKAQVAAEKARREAEAHPPVIVPAPVPVVEPVEPVAVVFGIPQGRQGPLTDTEKVAVAAADKLMVAGGWVRQPSDVEVALWHKHKAGPLTAKDTDVLAEVTAVFAPVKWTRR